MTSFRIRKTLEPTGHETGTVNPTKRPFFGGQCYACNAKATGLRDRSPEGGWVEPACARHTDPTIPVFDACVYCIQPARRGSVVIDGEFAHKSCHAEACK